MTEQPRPAMTMREIREGLGHPVPPPGVPEPNVQPTGYVVSCLPEGHDDRWTYTVRVSYRGEGLWSLQCRGQYVDANGQRSPGFAWSGGPDEPATQAEMDAFDAEQAVWLKAYRFDHDTALRLACELAPNLTYRGRTVADALTASPVSGPVTPTTRPEEHPMTDLHLIISQPGPGAWYGRQDVLEALEAAGWTADDDMPLSIVRHPSGAVWAVTNESDDSGLDLPNGTVVEFPGSTPTVVIVAACLAAAATP